VPDRTLFDAIPAAGEVPQLLDQGVLSCPDPTKDQLGVDKPSKGFPARQSEYDQSHDVQWNQQIRKLRSYRQGAVRQVSNMLKTNDVKSSGLKAQSPHIIEKTGSGTSH